MFDLHNRIHYDFDRSDIPVFNDDIRDFGDTGDGNILRPQLSSCHRESLNCPMDRFRADRLNLRSFIFPNQPCNFLRDKKSV